MDYSLLVGIHYKDRVKQSETVSNYGHEPVDFAKQHTKQASNSADSTLRSTTHTGSGDSVTSIPTSKASKGDSPPLAGNSSSSSESDPPPYKEKEPEKDDSEPVPPSEDKLQNKRSSKPLIQSEAPRTPSGSASISHSWDDAAEENENEKPKEKEKEKNETARESENEEEKKQSIESIHPDLVTTALKGSRFGPASSHVPINRPKQSGSLAVPNLKRVGSRRLSQIVSSSETSKYSVKTPLENKFDIPELINVNSYRTDEEEFRKCVPFSPYATRHTLMHNAEKI